MRKKVYQKDPHRIKIFKEVNYQEHGEVFKRTLRQFTRLGIFFS